MRRRKKHWYRKLGLIALLLAIALVTAAAAATHFTEGSRFCGTTCHEMSPYYATWQRSSHRTIACVRCHIKPGAVALAEAKLAGLHEVYVHTTRGGSAPVYVTSHIPDSTCTSCHHRGSEQDPLTLRGAAPVAFSHAAHLGARCTDCHAQVVHHSTPGHPYADPKAMAFCLRCHNGTKAAGTCQTCHRSPHDPRGACTSCHTLASWASTFEHPVALGAQHSQVACEQCHTHAKNGQMGLPAGCVTCHPQRHHDRIATTLCARCHRPSGFLPATFAHPKTGCQRCHTPPHPDRGVCTRCHTQRTWASRFKHPIALAGAHATFACEKCHTHGLNRPGLSCTSCHGSQHGGLTQCGSCHRTIAWQPPTFHHAATTMPGWQNMACTACHPSNAFAHVYCTCHGGIAPGG